MAEDKQKIDRKNLSIAIDAALENTEIALQKLISKTGKSQNEIYEEIISDDEVEACREDLRTSILAEKWNLLSEDVSEDLVNRLWIMVEKHLEDFADLAMLSRFYGFSVGEYIYKQEPDGFITLDKILNKDGELDYYEPKRNGELIYKAEGEVSLDLNYKFLFLPSKATPYRPAGEMMILRAFPAVLLRRKSWAFAGQFITRYAQPYTIGTLGGYGEAKEFTNTLINFSSNGGVAVKGEADDINIEQLSGTAESFEIIEKMANSRIQKLILGRTRTGDLDNGSKAAQDTEEKRTRARISAYLNLMKKGINHALNAVIAVNNSWGLKIPQGKISFDYQALENVDLQKAQRDQIYLNAGLELDKSYFVEVLGYEERHIKGFGEVKSDRLKVKGGEMLNLAQKPFTSHLSSLRSAANAVAPLSSHLNSPLTFHLSPLTLDEEQSEEMTEEEQKELNTFANSINKLLEGLGITWEE